MSISLTNNVRKQTRNNETALIERARKGDERAFLELVRMHEKTVFNFAFKLCRDREAAEETMQDTFINVYRKLVQFTGRSKFSTWLYSIVANNCLMKRRRGKLDKALVSFEETVSHSESAHRGTTPDVLPWHDTPLDRAMTKELREVLDEAIKKLPMEYRVVFTLRDIEGLSAEETGKVLRLRVPAVKSRLRRARVFLRGQLNDYMTS